MRGAVIILAIAIVLAAAIIVYFSPFQSCVRSVDSDNPAFTCARLLGGAR